jgi:hypothetical protein
MKFYAIILLLFIAPAVAAQRGYEIKVTLKPFRNEYVYLGYYYGKQLPVIDSALLNEKSQGVFEGQKKLGGGIYFITYPDHSVYFNLLIDRNQKFTVVADTSQPSKITFTSSPENTVYTAYLDSIKKMNGKLDSLFKQYQTNKQDSARIIEQMENTDAALKKYRKNTSEKDPDGLLALLLKAMADPVVPENDPAAKSDSLFGYKYFKAHYWDNVTFYDDRLLRSPFFEPKLDYYFNQLVYPSADSVNKKIEWMLGYSRINEEMQKFLLMHFINRYRNQKHSWEDTVYLNLYEKYFSNKTYPWLTGDAEKNISAKAYSIMASSKGKPATDIELPGLTGEKRSLYKVDAPYTVVIIWDATCEHCKHDLPIIDSLYKAQWQAMGVKIFAMSQETDGSREDWSSFISTNNLTGWVHVYNSKANDKLRTDKGLLSYPQLYDLTGFPVVYLLDSDKHIIAKKISYKQVSDILLQMQKAKHE